MVWEERWHPLREEWVIVAAHRQNRPWSGGTVAVLGHKGARAAVEAVAQEYERRTGHAPLIISGSSPGAAAFGHLVVS